MTDAIPDFQKMTPEERTKLAADLRKRAGELEKQGEAAQKKLTSAQTALAEAEANAAKARAEVDALFDKSYYLRRMAHAVEMYSQSPPPSQP